MKLLILSILATLSSALASYDNNKHGGHGLFHGFEEIGKTAWLEEPKLAEKFRHPKFTPEPNFDDFVVISRAPSNRNDLLENSDVKLKHSSLYLQPEPRGLQYMLHTADFNPFLGHYMRKREVNQEFINYPDGHSFRGKCPNKFIVCALRNKRNANPQGQVIPGSRGQAVLYGVPQLPEAPRTLQEGQLPGGQNIRYGSSNQNLPTQNLPGSPDGSFNYGYKTYGY